MKTNNDPSKNSVNPDQTLIQASMHMSGNIPNSCIRPGCEGRIVKSCGSSNKYQCIVCKTEYFPLNIPSNEKSVAVIIHPEWLAENFSKDCISQFKNAINRREAQRLQLEIKSKQKAASRLAGFGMGGIITAFIIAKILLPNIIENNSYLIGGVALLIAMIIGLRLIMENNKLEKLRRTYANVSKLGWVYETKIQNEMVTKFMAEVAGDHKCRKE